MKNPPLENLAGEQVKDKVKILRFLKTVPHLDFSDKGIENISKRFRISPEYLQELIKSVLIEGGRKDGKY